MELIDIQKDVDSWLKKNGGYWNKFEVLARLIEEVGEASSALQINSGLRYSKKEADLEIELGDILFTLIAFANLHEIDLTRAINKSFSKYNHRLEER